MYPLSHLYVSFSILKQMDPALALGSVLPDILVSAGLVWRDAHRTLQKPFQEHLTPTLQLGAALHGIDLPGLDYYSDIAYADGQGYAYQKANNIEADIISLGVDPDHALWRGHNFIEMAIEIELSQQKPELWSYLSQAKNDYGLKNQVHQLTKLLKAPRPRMFDAVLNRFLVIQGKKDALAADYAKKLNNIYSLSIQPRQCGIIISKAQSIIHHDYASFLADTIAAISQSALNRLLTQQRELPFPYLGNSL